MLGRLLAPGRKYKQAETELAAVRLDPGRGRRGAARDVAACRTSQKEMHRADGVGEGRGGLLKGRSVKVKLR